MIKKALLAAASLASLVAVPAHADLSFNVGAVTDYRYRGISQSRLDPALQGGADWVQGADGGFYAGIWGSTIRWIKDTGRASVPAYDAGNARVEVDLYGGYKGSIAEGLGYDVGLLQYWYPRNKLDRNPAFEKADTTELYGALSFGPVTAKYSHALTDTFGNLDSKNSFYFDLSASFPIADGWALVPHVGYQKIKGPNEDLASYTDYSVGVSKDFSGFVVSATAVGTNAEKSFYYTPAGKFTGKSALVVGVKYNF